MHAIVLLFYAWLFSDQSSLLFHWQALYPTASIVSNMYCSDIIVIHIPLFRHRDYCIMHPIVLCSINTGPCMLWSTIFLWLCSRQVAYLSLLIPSFSDWVSIYTSPLLLLHQYSCSGTANLRTLLDLSSHFFLVAKTSSILYETCLHSSCLSCSCWLW